MGLLIAGVIFIIAVIIALTTSKKSERLSDILASLLAIAAFWGFSIFIVALMEDKEWEYNYKDIPVYSAFNDSKTELYGHFILGCGTIRGSAKAVYVVYGEFEQGKKRIELNTSTVYLKETDDEIPTIRKYWVQRYVPARKNWWLVKERPEEIGDWKENVHGDKTLVVPTGTIYKNFEIK